MHQNASLAWTDSIILNTFMDNPSIKVMHSLKKVLISGLILCGSHVAIAQDSVQIRYEKSLYKLGKVMEADGVVKHRFSFTNLGTQAVEIDRVEVSCGCTAPSWSQGAIAGGQKGYVDVNFDPHNRPGPFDKSLTVHYKQSQLTSVLTIKGFVVPRPESVEAEFPLQIGDLRFKQRFLNLGNVSSRGLYAKSFEVYNSSSNILVFQDHMEGPDHITITFEPYTLKPKSRGLMWVHYDVAAKDDLGYFREDVAIFTYESKEPRKDLVITTTLMDLPKATTGDQPQAYFSETIQDFGIKQQGDTVFVNYPLHNKGQLPLEIKKAFPSCNCVRVSVDDTTVAAGDSTQIKAMFLTHQRLGNQHKTITVFSNDPQQPVMVLTLKGLLRGPRD